MHSEFSISILDLYCSYPSCIKLASIFQGERNFNRFGGWLGKNSTMGKNLRLLKDLHVHLLASRGSSLGRYLFYVLDLGLLYCMV